MTLPACFDRFRDEIEAELRAVLEGRESPLYLMLRYHLGWTDGQGNPVRYSSGKALRPTLCLLSCDAVGGDYRRALPAAAALELVHNYSLIHDDIQDGDRERRHRPTVWCVWGKPQAINAGDVMRALADLSLQRLEAAGIPLEVRARAHQVLAETDVRLVEGQYLDIEFETRIDTRVADYLEMIARKTGALIACSVEMGAMLGTRDERTIRELRQAGHDLGMAFQIRDDILGIWGDPTETGKATANDIRRRKKTLPIVFAFENASGAARKELEAISRKETLDSADVAKALEIIEGVGAQAMAQRMIDDFSRAARGRIENLQLKGTARQQLDELIDFLVERNF